MKAAATIPPVAALITGVGYIGSALLGRLLARGERVVGLENFYCTPRADIASLAEHDGFTLVEGDVANPADVDQAFSLASALDGAPLTVYHLAAQPSAGAAAQDPDYTERANLVGARVVLQAARSYGARVVFGGSFRVYGDTLRGEVDECNPYGRVGDLSHLSKVYVEQLGRMLEVPFVSVRLGVTYGLAPIMKRVPGFMTVPNLFCQRAAQGETLAVHEDRAVAFIHIQDAARALLAAGDQPWERIWRAANAAPEVRTIGDVAQLVQRLARERGQQVPLEGRLETHPARVAEAGFRVRSSLDAAGFRPEHHLDDALGAVLDHFRDRAVVRAGAGAN